MQLTDTDRIRSITSEWSGERDARGRPLVPLDILERMKAVTTEEAWGVLRSHGYHHNFVGGFIDLSSERRPVERVMVGRAITCRWVPIRPDLHDTLVELGEDEGRIGFLNSWVIDEMVEGDVLVADLFSRVNLVGDNLTAAIVANGGRGMVIDGGIRDTQRIIEFPDFGVYMRRMHPEAIPGVTMPDINGVTRINTATCVPGDVVLGTMEGVIFIPPHLAEEVVVRSESVRLRDEFGQQRIAEGVYTPGEVDREFSEDMERDFSQWVADRQQDQV
ncbi:MAG: RraA family protein [Dehalococcoidia bacterium]|jgi:regulator of RNase E activity RraA|nr:RraA family protein [Dehalococcoidia bacterium]